MLIHVEAHDENTKAFSRFFFNARVMRPVSGCDPSTTILGHKSAIPVFVSAAGLAKLGHPLGIYIYMFRASLSLTSCRGSEHYTRCQ